MKPVVCVVVMLAVALAAPVASADVVVPKWPGQDKPTQEAEDAAAKAYGKAEKHLRRRRYKKALAQADKAYDNVANASTALLRAAILARMKRHREAFEAFLLASEMAPTPEEKAFIDQGLADSGKACTPPMGWLVVVTTPKAEVKVDDVAFTSPRAVGITEGRHSIEVTAEGYLPTKAGISAIPGVGQRVEYKLLLQPPPPKPIPEVPDVGNGNGGTGTGGTGTGGTGATGLVGKAEIDNPYTTPGYALVATGVVVLAFGGGMHAWGFDRAAATDDLALPQVGLTSETRQVMHAQATDDMNLANALAMTGYAVGGAALVAGIVLLVLDPPAPAEATEPPDASSDSVDTVIGPTVFPGGAGVTARVIGF